jgi:hypothetical protein
VNAQERAARHEKALELHLAGATYRAIADTLGFSSTASVHEAVQKALKARKMPGAGQSEAVQTELARLDAMLVGLWANARRGNVAAVDRVLKIGERRVALLALADAADEEAAKPAPAEQPMSLVDQLKARRDAKRAAQ